ncbi:MAG: hypothetical protein MUE60_11875 [Candidatus Eisenbacteria bacterium]|jgi:hypothetical protein|nr:hypothetical protein [Candidatus Eisenbacteria bacterium]
MRHEWYGDNRDLLKWATLVRLARENGAAVLWIWLLTDNETRFEFAEPDGADFPEEVIEHFRDLDDIDRLAARAGIEISHYRRPYQGDSIAWFDDVIAGVRAWFRSSPDPIILFLDPDTGLEPESGSTRAKHIRPGRIAELFGILRPGDTLVLYQHRWRDKEWKNITTQRLAEALGCTPKELQVFYSPVAADVALFAHTKDRP